MNVKTLRKKISKLETRLQEGPAKLAKWKQKLAVMEKAKAQKARRKSASRTVSVEGSNRRRNSPAKVKRKLNLSPERRAQLAAAMKARWAAKRAAAGTTPQNDSSDQTPPAA